MIITQKETRNFSIKSKDKNKIHLNKKYSSNFFFKDPIVHGINVLIKAIKHFIKKKKFSLYISELDVNFDNFILVGEKFYFKSKKNKIFVYNELNNKLTISINFKKTNKKISNISLNKNIIKDLLYITYYVGSIKPGNGSLIHKIKISNNYNDDYDKKIIFSSRKLNNNVYQLLSNSNEKKINILCSKLKLFKTKKSILKISKKSKEKIKGKKILIFGQSSDLASRMKSESLKKICKIYFFSFRINNHKKKFNLELNKMKNTLINIKPDYLFFFSSPKIYSGGLKNRYLFNLYKKIYVDYFKNILIEIKKNKLQTIVFYPSTFAVKYKKKYKKIESYIHAKILGEKLCLNKKYKRIVKFYRLPQLISRTNYNILGRYEGKPLNYFDKYLNLFLK